MQRIYTKVATGIAPDGRWYAGDVNQLQDVVAAITDLAQVLSVGQLRIGESGLAVVHYGSGEARLTGKLRIDNLLRALGGIYLGAFTDTERNALPEADRGFGVVIENQTRGRFEWNVGTGAAPVWYPIACDMNGDLVMPPGGTIIVGDIIIDGTKPPVTLIGSGQKTSDTAITATTEGTANTIVTSTEVVLDDTANLQVIGYLPSVNVTSGGPGDTFVVLYDGSNPIGIMSKSSMTQPFSYGPARPEFSKAFAAGSHTFSIRMYLSSIAGATVKAGSGGIGTYVPATIRVEKA
jgi:hypothetical protein